MVCSILFVAAINKLVALIGGNALNPILIVQLLRWAFLLAAVCVVLALHAHTCMHSF
jgi:hypothetical protein